MRRCITLVAMKQVHSVVQQPVKHSRVLWGSVLQWAFQIS